MEKKIRKVRAYLGEMKHYMLLSKYTSFFDDVDDVLFEIKMDVKLGKKPEAEEVIKRLEEIGKETERKIEKVIINDTDEAWVVLQDIDKELRFSFVAIVNREICNCSLLRVMDIKKFATIALREKLKVELRELIKLLKTVFSLED